VTVAAPPQGVGRIGFIDIAASGRGPDSFPAEIGWAVLGGSSGAMLVKPAPSWSHDAWDDSRADLHGIGWATLQQHGQVVDIVAEQLNRVFGPSSVVFSDAVDWNRFWVERLFDEVASTRTFEVLDVWRGLSFLVSASTLKRTRANAASSNRQHRARADAELLRRIWTEALAAH